MTEPRDDDRVRRAQLHALGRNHPATLNRAQRRAAGYRGSLPGEYRELKHAAAELDNAERQLKRVRLNTMHGDPGAAVVDVQLDEGDA